MPSNFPGQACTNEYTKKYLRKIFVNINLTATRALPFNVLFDSFFSLHHWQETFVHILEVVCKHKSRIHIDIEK